MLPDLSRLRPAAPTDATLTVLRLSEDAEMRPIPGLTYAVLPDALSEHHTRSTSDLYAVAANGSCVAVVSTAELEETPDLCSAIGRRAVWLKYRTAAGRFDAAEANAENTALDRTELAKTFEDDAAAEGVLETLAFGAPMHLYVDLASKEATIRNETGPFVYLGAYSQYATHKDTYRLNVGYNGHDLAKRVRDAVVTNEKRGCAIRALGEVARRCGFDSQRHQLEALCDEDW